MDPIRYSPHHLDAGRVIWTRRVILHVNLLHLLLRGEIEAFSEAASHLVPHLAAQVADDRLVEGVVEAAREGEVGEASQRRRIEMSAERTGYDKRQYSSSFLYSETEKRTA